MLLGFASLVGVHVVPLVSVSWIISEADHLLAFKHYSRLKRLLKTFFDVHLFLRETETETETECEQGRGRERGRHRR